MTRVKVVAGACGFTSVVKVTRVSGTKVQVQVFSACRIIRSMSEDLQEIDWLNGMFVKKISESVVYQSASRRLVHTDCPLPCAILKAILIEVEAMLPNEVSMKFEKSKGDSS